VPGDIGVVYVVSEQDDTYELRLVFPEYVNHPTDVAPSMTTTGPLVVFDVDGPVAELEEPIRFQLAFWCENDAGTQFRPEALVQVPKSTFARPLEPIAELQGLAAFAAFAAGQTHKAKNDGIQASIYPLRGDLDANGALDAIVWVAPDDAMNCDGDPPNNVSIYLQTSDGASPLRCCGP
jgi:hypothetical protein